MKVTIIDYGAGNVPSVERALQRLGAETERTSTPECIANSKAIVLPGVGHFAALIRALDAQRIRQTLLESIRQGVPYLGICLGMQALFESSEEAPGLLGLGLLSGEVRALPSNVKLPHMGWNQIAASGESRLLGGIDSSAYFYFAHSYAASDSNGATVAACFHGTPFAAVVERQNICGVQFHPEKSGDTGTRVLENFRRIAG